MEMKTEDNSKQDVMVSNLPLLFSDGKPTSITSMSVEDLQYFIPFLIKCILGCEPSGWARYTKFKWWPLDVPWSPIILTKKYQTNNWRSKLTTLVKNCYNYNGCTYLLQFSAKLQTLTGGYKFEDNWDGTTSMYDSTNGKLLVTFQNENMIYDKGFRQQSSAPRPMLLPRLNSPTSPTKLNAGASNAIMGIEAPTAAKMVEPPVNDIYLCDYCGADFSSLSAIKAHEAKCMADKALEVQSNNSNSLNSELETRDMDEAQFLWYLSLSSRSQTLPPPNVTPAKIRPVVRRTCTLSDKRFTTIPFSSNLGQSFFKAIKLTPTASESLVSRYERFCAAKPTLLRSVVVGEHAHQSLSGTTSNRFRPVVYKRKDEWAHSYSFNKADRRERMETIATGLNKRARQLLQRCKVIHVTVVKLKPDEIENWTRPKPKPKHPSHMIQPWLQRSIANLPATCTISLAPVDSLKPFHRYQQTASPATSRQVSNNSLDRKSQARAPPGLLPLITGTWSMQPNMQSVNSKPTKSHFILPDLIPVVNRHSKTRTAEPVIIRMPSVSSPKSVTASPRIQSTSVSNTDIVDLCSSEEEFDNEDQRPANKDVLPNTLVLPPGISITKVNKTSSAAHCRLPFPHSRLNETLSEKNNNRSRSVSQWLASAATVSLPILTFMGQSQPVINKELSSSDISFGGCSADSSLPIVTPLKLGKLPAEKREQMKQSLLKIQKKEKKSPPSNTEPSSPSTQMRAIQNSDLIDPLQLSPFPRSSVSPKKDLSSFFNKECKELKHNELSGLLCSNQQFTRRKREKEPDFHSCDEEDSLSDGPSKKARMLGQSPSSICLASKGRLVGGSDNYSSVIEVDLGGLNNEMCDSSRASSFGSLTPDSKVPRKKIRERNEVSLLLNDECKELRRKGLEDLSFEASSNQRVTRCRTKSQPPMSGKR